jgi:hypothetical protein
MTGLRVESDMNLRPTNRIQHLLMLRALVESLKLRRIVMLGMAVKMTLRR